MINLTNHLQTIVQKRKKRILQVVRELREIQKVLKTSLANPYDHLAKLKLQSAITSHHANTEEDVDHLLRLDNTTLEFRNPHYHKDGRRHISLAEIIRHRYPHAQKELQEVMTSLRLEKILLTGWREILLQISEVEHSTRKHPLKEWEKKIKSVKTVAMQLVRTSYDLKMLLEKIEGKKTVETK